MPFFKYYNSYKKPIFVDYYNHQKHYTPSVNCTSNLFIEPSHSSQNTEESSPLKQDCSNYESNDNVWLDLFGIKLYFDDVLILSLLFFLYQEDVKDDGLFLSLVLLLIS